MKSINFFKVLLPVIFFSAYLTGCDEEDTDLTPPMLSNVSLNDQTENIQVNPGEDLLFEANFEDDEQLGQVKINIHDNFDGHSHGRIMAEPWTLERIFDLMGKTEALQEVFNVPENAATGPYHFNIQFFDAAGNEGELKIIEFEIVDESEQPGIIVTNPDFSTEVKTSPGGTFLLEGMASDPDGLDELHIMIVHEEEDGHEYGRIKENAQEQPVWEKEWELDGATEVLFSEQVTIPSSAETGHYVIRMMAMDVNNNVNILKKELHIE